MSKTYTLQAIAEALEGQLIGNGAITVDRVAHPADIRREGELVLATDKKLLPLLGKHRPRAVIVSQDAAVEPGFAEACIVVSRPRLAMAKLTSLFAEHASPPPGIHPTAIVEPGAQLGENVTLGAYAYVASGARIGANSILHPQTYIGPGTTIGREALIYPGVRIGARVEIGDRCIIHFNAAIGADGFSFVTPEQGSVEAVKATGSVTATNQELVRIASLGTVVIGDDVEIGANTSIDRGTIAATRIGNGTKIDNQVQVGHNVTIGENCLICGRVGIAGSSSIGDRVVLGGAVGVADHVIVGDDVVAMAMSGIAGHIAARTVVGGIPALPRAQAVENYMNLGRIKSLMQKLNALTGRVDKLEQKGKND
ncbi:MAG: UDP-3-O-(3-hydroxymyristoyl)glucosamine N-acyltransferase [Alphaproteobacteria bacterium]|nr:UDP-3-O-(3-hydroxymyristoyl)glucosamine N-acyltransferase [Alphaproteobacteria bacterium]